MCAAQADMTFTREFFDEADARLDAQRDIPNMGAEGLAWGQSYIMRGYVEMYRATGDPDYFRRLVKVADQALETRDDAKAARNDAPAARDGKTADPVWSIDGKFTVARLTLKDTAGRDAILIRSIRYGYNDGIAITIKPGTQPDTFALTTASEFWAQHLNSDVTFDNLSLDPASPRYFPRVINNPNYVADDNFSRNEDVSEEASVVIVALDTREDKNAACAIAPVDSALLVPDLVEYHGYNGPIYSGMMQFAAIVYADPSLHAEFKATADRYLKAAQEAFDAWEPLWREGPAAGEGYYLSIERGGGLWWDGIMAPFNYLASAGQALLNIYDCTGDKRALDHCTKMAQMLKSSLTLTENNSYVFYYWVPSVFDSWTRENHLSLNTPNYPSKPTPDDLSHGAWTVEFAVMCYQRGIVFTRKDMQRFARTFERNVYRGRDEHVAVYVDGTGEGTVGHDVSAPRWLDLCTVEPRLFYLSKQLYEKWELENSFYENALGSYARMYRWQEELATSK